MTIADEAGLDPRVLLGNFSSPLWFPRYRPGVWGPWSVRVIAMMGARGYWGQT